jgi:flagellar biosynthesis protein FliP
MLIETAFVRSNIGMSLLHNGMGALDCHGPYKILFGVHLIQSRYLSATVVKRTSNDLVHAMP